MLKALLRASGLVAQYHQTRLSCYMFWPPLETLAARNQDATASTGVALFVNSHQAKTTHRSERAFDAVFNMQQRPCGPRRD